MTNTPTQDAHTLSEHDDPVTYAFKAAEAIGRLRRGSGNTDVLYLLSEFDHYVERLHQAERDAQQWQVVAEQRQPAMRDMIQSYEQQLAQAEREREEARAALKRIRVYCAGRADAGARGDWDGIAFEIEEMLLNRQAEIESLERERAGDDLAIEDLKQRASDLERRLEATVEELRLTADGLTTIRDDMQCDAGNPDGGSVQSCEHCQMSVWISRVENVALDALPTTTSSTGVDTIT